MRVLLLLVLALLLVGSVGTVAAQSSDASAAAIAWIRGQQQPDGSFPGFGPGDTADVVLALVAAGEDPASVKQTDKSPLDYLASQAASYGATGVGPASKLVLAATAAGSDPRSFGGADLPALIGASYDTATGQYGNDLTGHCLGLLAIRSLGATPPDAAFARLQAVQLHDGGWSFDGTPATGSDTNTTALCIEALVAHGRINDTPRALAYLKSQQNADGGFPYSQTSQFGNASDANSTALGIQALAALGEDTSAAVQALAALQNPSGAFRFQADQPDDNGLATYQAVAGLLAQPLPLAIRSVAGAQAAVAPGGSAPALPVTSEMIMNMPALAFIALLLLGAGWSLRATCSYQNS